MSERPVMLLAGSSRGIGLGIAKHFVAKGYAVAGCSRGKTTYSHEFYSHTELDLSDESRVRRWVRSARDAFGRIDVAICAAAHVRATLPFTLTPGAVLDAMLRTNVAGTFYVCREAARIMMLQRSGRIITLSSMAAGLHQPGASAYAASKSAVVEMTKVLARELAPAGITCNVVGVSMVMTESVEALGAAVIERALDSLTIKRMSTVEEVCNVIDFFCAPLSSCITGQVVQMGLVT